MLASKVRCRCWHMSSPVLSDVLKTPRCIPGITVSSGDTVAVADDDGE